MFVLQQWMWMGLTLTAITFAFTLRSLLLTWVCVASAIVGTIVWADPTVPNLYQLLIFGAITLVGMVLSQFFIQPAVESEQEEAPVKAVNPSKIVNRTYTLTEPIVNGYGQIEIDGTLWRLRGEDAAAGEQVRVLRVDGLERDLLIVEREEWARNNLDVS